MALTNMMTMMSVPVEIGRSSDWDTQSLITPIGMLNHDSGELNIMRSGPTSYEIWHPTGLKLKVDFAQQLEDCADLLAEELEQREP